MRAHEQPEVPTYAELKLPNNGRFNSEEARYRSLYSLLRLFMLAKASFSSISLRYAGEVSEVRNMLACFYERTEERGP